MVNINALPVGAKKLYRQAYNHTFKRVRDPVIANKVAWITTKKQFSKIGGAYVAKGLGLDFYTFSMSTVDDVFIKKADDGEYYLEATLSDDKVDGQGKRFTASALKAYAEQINKYGIAGFITHADWDDFKMANSHLSEEEFIVKARTERKGILKTVKAIFSKGKLWIKALIDKRYLKRVSKYNRVSIEALVPTRFQSRDEYKGGYALGFALDNNPVNPRAKAYITT